MIELFNEDIFDKINIADAICIPTNCSIVQYGINVPMNPMGALAGAAARRWDNIPYIYAELLRIVGAVPCVLGYIFKEKRESSYEFFTTSEYYDINKELRPNFTALIAFPTMYEIGAPASISLVERSARLLVELADSLLLNNIYMGAPGCGVGGLSYNDEVKPLLNKIFDDKFYVMQRDMI